MRPSRLVGWANPRRFLPLLAVVVFAGCSASTGDDGRGSVTWDLSETNDIAALAWPDHRPTAFGLDDGTDVTVRLPGGQIFEGKARVEAFRVAEKISEIAFTHPPMTVEDAYRLAVDLADRFDIDADRLDAWQARRQANDDPSNTAFTSSQDSQPMAAGGPVPSIKVSNSFNDERPVRVAFVLSWDIP